MGKQRAGWISERSSGSHGSICIEFDLRWEMGDRPLAGAFTVHVQLPAAIPTATTATAAIDLAVVSRRASTHIGKALGLASEGVLVLALDVKSLFILSWRTFRDSSTRSMFSSPWT